MKTIDIASYQKRLDMGRFDFSDRKFYQSVLDSVKKQNGKATERQFNILQQIIFGKNVYSTKNEHIYNKNINEMNQLTQLRQLIKESIQEYIREIDEAGNIAALEAKMGKTKESIELREKKMNMEGIDEAYHDMIDKGKMKELASEVKALKKSLSKYEKQLEKLKNKGNKSEKHEETEEKEVIDESPEMEVKMDEADPNAGPQLEENEINEGPIEHREYKGLPYIIRYDAPKGYIAMGKGEIKNEINPQYFDKLSDADEHAELEIDGYLDSNINERLYMQKIAGILSEREYNEKIEEARFKKGTDIGKKGKGFSKIAKSAAKKYGSEEEGEKVAGAILKKVLKKK